MTSLTSQFTEDELTYIRRAVILSDQGSYAKNVKGMGGFAPQAPHDAVDDLRACLSPKWIQLGCIHDNTTWRKIRCRWCDGCKRAWKATVRAKILSGALGATVYMWTLTMKEYPSQINGDIYDEAQNRWHDLLRSASNSSLSFEYLRVTELQKRKTPHFHSVVKEFRQGAELLQSTEGIYRRLRKLSKMAGFGSTKGKTIDFQRARYGGAGAASYLSKYLSKSEDYNKMRRDDGRAIRRYNASRGWTTPRPSPVWRYTRTGAFSPETQNESDVLCSCGKGQLINKDIQAQAWINKSRREGRWVGPLGVVDYILEKEITKTCEL